jgi:hypothetical protein
MTFQEAQDFAMKLLPDDAVGPLMIQQEDDHAGKCLVKIYQSKALASLFPASDFMTADGKDGNPGTVTVNFYPDLNYSYSSVESESRGQDGSTDNLFLDHNQVNSVLINLGSVPSC